MVDRLAGRGSERRRSFDAPTLVALAVLLAIVAGAVAARKPLVAFAPGLASLYERLGLDVNRTGLAFDDVHSIRDIADGLPGLVVEGTIRNVTSGTVAVPPLALELLDDGGGRVGGWRAEPAQASLAAGETQKFRTRLSAPPEQAKQVSVSFMLAGGKG